MRRPRPHIALPAKGDITIALKTINLAPELTASEKRVAGILLDHFNRKTGRCDPSIERVAKLSGVSTRTVMRSLSRVEAMGLFKRFRHGGNFNTNQYQPNWSTFRTFDAAWSVKFRLGRYQAAAPAMSPEPRQFCQVKGDSAVDQTLPTNQSKRTSSEEAIKGSRGARRVATTPLRRTVSSDQAARSAAERRWHLALQGEFVRHPNTYEQIVAAVTPAMQDAATEAELQRPGAGLPSLLNALRLPL